MYDLDLDDVDADLEIDDVEADDTLDSDVEADVDLDDAELPDDGDALAAPPDPFGGSDAAPVSFGGDKEVEFPDGTHVENPYEDASGYTYKSWDDYVHEENKYEAEDGAEAEAEPA